MITLRGHILLTALLLNLSSVADSTRVVYGYIGHSVALPCKYNAGYYGALHMCWGRGYVPSRGCSNEIISTDGQKVTYRQSHRYRLTGNLEKGDVSLTIADTVGSDAGIYGCRVQIPGWFNDQKEAVHLILQTAPTTTTQAPVTTERETTVNPTTAPTTTTQAPVTTERETTVNPTTAPTTTTQAPVTTEEETTVNPTTAPTTTTQASVITERETTVNPTTEPTTTQASVTAERKTTVNPTTAPTSVEGPVEKIETDTTRGPTEETTNTRATPEWSFGPKTTNPTTLDTVTRVQPRLQSTAVPTHWLTDSEAEPKPTSTIQAEGDLDNMTTTLTSDWTPDNSTSPAEEAHLFSPPLQWILGPTLLLAAILVTAIVLHMRRKHKAGSFELPREPNKPCSTFLVTPDLPMTPDPALELDSKTVTEMETMVPLEEGESAERCP